MFAVGDKFCEPGWDDGTMREVVSIGTHLVTIRYFNPKSYTDADENQAALTLGFVRHEINSGRWVKV